MLTILKKRTRARKPEILMISQHVRFACSIRSEAKTPHRTAHMSYGVVGLISAQTSMQVRKTTSSTASAYALQRGIANYFSPGFLHQPFSTPLQPHLYPRTSVLSIGLNPLIALPRQTMAEHPTPPPQPLSPDAGPTDPNLPKLPAGWIAQWDGSSRKYYYVQISTGHSQWDIPADPAPSAVSPAGTPAQASGPYDKPQEGQHGMEEGEGMRGVDGQTGERSGGLSGMAINMLTGQGGKHSGGQGQQSGLGGLAASFLGGGGQSHGGGGHGQSGGGGLVGQLAGSLLNSGKPSSQHSGGPGGGGSHGQGGLGGLLGGVLGGSHGGSHSKPNDYGYSHGGGSASSSTYTGQAPPTAYQPSNQHGTPSTTGQYGAPSQHGAASTPGQYNPSSQHGQHGAPSPPGQYGGSPTPGQYQPPGQHGQPSYGAPTQHQQQPGGYGQNPSYGGHDPYGQHQPGGHDQYGQQSQHGQGGYQSAPIPAPYGSPQGQAHTPGQYPPPSSGHNQYPPPPSGGYSQYPPPPSSGGHTQYPPPPSAGSTPGQYPPPPSGGHNQYPPPPTGQGQYPGAQGQAPYGQQHGGAPAHGGPPSHEQYGQGGYGQPHGVSGGQYGGGHGATTQAPPQPGW